MSGPVSAEPEFLSPARSKVLRRLLYVTLGIAVLVALLALPGLIGDFQRYVVTLLVIAAILGTVGGLALRAVQARTDAARGLCILTGVLLLLLSLPLVGILVGLFTAVLGIGLLVVVFAPERDQA